MKNTLREDLMDAIRKRRAIYEENALFQPKSTTEGLIQALRYQFKAETADDYALIIDSVLRAHKM